MSRLLATGDWHVGKGRALHPGRLAEQEDAVRGILEAARAEQVDGILLAGDAFDKRRPDSDEMLAVERPLVEHRDAGGCPIIAIVGNHDLAHADVACGLDVLAEAGLLKLFREPGQTYVGDTAVTLLPWAPVSRLRALLGAEVTVDEVNQACADLLVRIAAEEKARVAGGPHVLLGHWSVDAAVLPSGMSVADLREVVLPLDGLQDLGFDAIVLSHIHRGQRLDDDPTILYTGPPLALDFGDTQDGYGYWLLIDGVTPQPGHARFVPLESPRFVTLDANEAGSADGLEGHYVRLVVRATEDEARSIDARAWERDLLDDGARYARVEVQVERAARARVEQLDDQVDDGHAFGMWLESQQDLDRETGLVLTGMDTAYREKVAA